MVNIRPIIGSQRIWRTKRNQLITLIGMWRRLVYDKTSFDSWKRKLQNTIVLEWCSELMHKWKKPEGSSNNRWHHEFELLGIHIKVSLGNCRDVEEEETIEQFLCNSPSWIKIWAGLLGSTFFNSLVELSASGLHKIHKLI